MMKKFSNMEQNMITKKFRGIRPDDLHGRMGLRNPERGFRTEMYFSTIPGEIAGMCSCHFKQNKLDGRPTVPIYQNSDIPGVPHLIRGNRLDAVEFSHCQWQDELDYLAYDGVTIMQSYCFLMAYNDGQDLPQRKLDDIELFFIKLRESKVKTLLRFAYELSPTLSGPTAETVLKHLHQVSPLIKKYIDVIYSLQCGFIGKFGEWHNSFHHLQYDFDFHKTLMHEVVSILPECRKTMMRYPVYKQRIFGTAPLTEAEAHTMLPQARIGHFNDGFLANPPIHGGTFGRKTSGPGNSIQTWEEEYEYVAQESKYLPQDGELFWRDVGGAALPTDAVQLFNKWHYDTFGMVHGNILFEGVDNYSMDIWKKVPCDPLFLIDSGLPMSDGYFNDASGKHVWRSYYEYIRDHMGYRLELNEVKVDAAENIEVEVKLTNRGFSAPVNPRKVLFVLEKEGKIYDFEFDVDVRKLYGNNTSHTLKLTADIPNDMPRGTYKAGIALPDGCEVLENTPEYAIKLANPLEFANGINYLDMNIEIN